MVLNKGDILDELSVDLRCLFVYDKSISKLLIDDALVVGLNKSLLDFDLMHGAILNVSCC